MAQKPESKQERPLQSFTFKNFLAVNTTAARTGVPNENFYNLENAQPIGFANIHSIADQSAALHNYGADTIYTDGNVNISNTEYLLQASTTQKLFAYNVPGNSVAQINGAINLAGSGTTFAQWSNSTALLVDSTGYYDWNGSGNIVSIGGATGAPTSGSAIAVYQNRVWIIQGRTLFFSVAGSFTDFTVANGGGSIVLTDPVLRSNVTALFAQNGYLYIFGVSSVQALSDLYVPAGASPPTPNFTLLPLSGVVGTDQPSSVMVYGRLVLFASRIGVWSLYGTTVQSLSAPDPNNAYGSSINGTWQYVNFAQTVSGGQVNSNNLLCAAFLIKRNADPVFGSNTVIAMYQGDAAGGKWWTANFGALTRVTTAFVSGSPALFGYIGNILYQLFAVTTSSPAASISTAFWDFGDPITQKQVIRAGVAIGVLQNIGSSSMTLTVDTPESSLPVQLNIPGFIQWINNNDAIVTWQNNALSTVNWIGGLFSTYFGGTSHGYSKYVGMTVTTQDGLVFELNSFLVDYKWGVRWQGN